MKKLTWKGLVLSLIPMLAAFVVCFAALYSGSLNFFFFGAYKDWDAETITKYVFLFLFLLCAVVLVVLSFLGLLFGEKFGLVVHLIIVLGVLVIAFALFLTNFIVSVMGMVDFFRMAKDAAYWGYSYSAWYKTTYVFVNLLNMLAWALPLVFSAVLAAVYLILLKKLPKNALIKKVQDFVESKVPVENEPTVSVEVNVNTQSSDSESID